MKPSIPFMNIGRNPLGLNIQFMSIHGQKKPGRSSKCSFRAIRNTSGQISDQNQMGSGAEGRNQSGSIRNRTASASTGLPSSAKISLMVPLNSASISFMTFMASMIHKV